MKVIVPYDFTPVTRTALDHALRWAETLDGHIELLHIIKDEDERAGAEQQFSELLDGLKNGSRERVETRVRKGDIFKDISKEAQEGDAQLLVMGTHGAKGLQKILGSHAIKVVTSSNTPFVVTQAAGPGEKIERIVLPVDLTKESIQIVKFAGKLAQKFKAEIHLVTKAVKDEFLVRKLQNNINVARRQLKVDAVAHEVSSLPGKKSFHQEVMDYGAKHRADLFAIAHFPDSLIPQFDKFSQELITNKLEVPVLIVNAAEVGGVKGNYSFVGI